MRRKQHDPTTKTLPIPDPGEPAAVEDYKFEPIQGYPMLRRLLSIYAHLVEERLGVLVAQTRLYYTGEASGLPYLYWDKDPHTIQQTMGAFDAIVARIEAKDFAIPARPGKLCEGCDMRHYCDAKNWQFKK